MIKLDLINEVVTKTGVTKTKAEMAVETVFESMKKSLARGDRIELRGFGVFTVRPRKTGIGAIRAPAPRSTFLPAKRCASSLARNCSRSSSSMPVIESPVCRAAARFARAVRVRAD